MILTMNLKKLSTLPVSYAEKIIPPLVSKSTNQLNLIDSWVQFDHNQVNVNIS